MINIHTITSGLKQDTSIEAKMLLVTPTAAAEMLKNNVHNRKIKPGVVAKYCREHQLGEWMPCSAGIGFSVTGAQLDGQHRLKMIVETGIPAWMLIVTGLPDSSQQKIDRQSRRSIYDVMTLSGIATSKESVQWASAILRNRNGWGDCNLADAEVKAALENHRKAIFEIHKLVYSKRGQRGICRAGINAAFVLSFEKRPEITVEFVKQFLTGAGLSYDDPELKLRNYCLESYGSGSGAQSSDMRRAFYALNAKAEGRKIERLMQSTELI